MMSIGRAFRNFSKTPMCSQSASRLFAQWPDFRRAREAVALQQSGWHRARLCSPALIGQGKAYAVLLDLGENILQTDNFVAARSVPEACRS
jgi:hypothetical protein